MLKDNEQYFGETENIPEFDKSFFTQQTFFNIYLKYKLKKPFASKVRWNEFITMWYQEIDKNNLDPLFFLHQKMILGMDTKSYRHQSKQQKINHSRNGDTCSKRSAKLMS